MKVPVPSHHGQSTVEGEPPRFEITLPVPRHGWHSWGAAGSSAAMTSTRLVESAERPPGHPLFWGWRFCAEKPCMTRLRHALADESGWTLMETMVGLALAGTVLASTLMILGASTRSQRV